MTKNASSKQRQKGLYRLARMSGVSAKAGINERLEGDQNSEADTAILESACTDDLGQDMAEEGKEDSFLPPPITWLINSVRRRFLGRTTVI